MWVLLYQALIIQSKESLAFPLPFPAELDLPRYDKFVFVGPGTNDQVYSLYITLHHCGLRDYE